MSTNKKMFKSVLRQGQSTECIINKIIEHKNDNIIFLL